MGSILWNGGGEMMNVDGSVIAVSYSIVSGGFAGPGNLDEDPLLVPGPAGCHYLSQVAAGQPLDSPAVNGGALPAEVLGLNARTTRSDEVGDSGTVDMGYHFTRSGSALVMGDFDRSLKLDLPDIAALQQCFTAEGPVDVPPCCHIFDFEPDADIDLTDAESFVLAMTGP